MKVNYRIYQQRPNEAPTLYAPFEFEGDSIKECDEKATKHLKELGQKEENAWDELLLERIDVVEVTTYIARNSPEDHKKGSPRKTVQFLQPPA